LINEYIKKPGDFDYSKLHQIVTEKGINGRFIVSSNHYDSCSRWGKSLDLLILLPTSIMRKRQAIVGR